MTTREHVDRLTSRHIAKLLTRLGDTVAPVVTDDIKRQMRFLTDDIYTQVMNKETSCHERNQS